MLKIVKINLASSLIMIAVIIASVTSGFYLLLALLLVVAVALYLPRKMSFLTRIVSAYFLFFALNIIVTLLLGLLHIKYNIGILLTLYSLPIVMYALSFKHSLFQDQFTSWRADLLFGAMSAVFFILILLPFRGGYLNQLAILSNGEDNASHYALMNSIVTHKTLTYPYTPQQSGVLTNLHFYPQGLHVNLAINTDIFLRSSPHPNPRVLLKAYIAQICALYTLLFTTLLLCLKRISETFLSEKAQFWLLLSSSPILVYLLGFCSSLFMFTYGFHSQITAYTLLLLTILWLSTTTLTFKTRYLIGLAFASTASIVWFFLLPIFVGVFSAWLLINRASTLSALRDISLIIATILAAALAITPILIEHFGTGNTSVNTPGGAYLVEYSGIIAYSVLGLLFIVGLGLKKVMNGSFISLLVILFGASLLFSLSIATYQYATAGTVSYYFYKSLYLLPILGLLLTGGFASLVVKHLIEKKIYTGKWAVSIALSLVFACSYYVSFYYQAPGYINNYFKGNVVSRVDTRAIHTILERQPVFPNTEYDAVLPYGCDPVVSYVTQRWISALLLTDGYREKQLLYPDILNKNISNTYMDNYPVSSDHLDVLYDPTCSVVPTLMSSPSMKIDIVPIRG